MLLEHPTGESCSSNKRELFSLPHNLWPPEPPERHTGRYEVQAATSVQPRPAASQPRRLLFLKQKEYSTFFTLSIFLSPSPTSSLLPPRPRGGEGKQNGCGFSRLNTNKSGSRRRPADRDVLGGFATRRQKPVSKIYRKHLAKSLGRSRGRRTRSGPRDRLPGRGAGNGCGIPGLRRAHTAVRGPLAAPWCFPPGIPVTCLSDPSARA